MNNAHFRPTKAELQNDTNLNITFRREGPRHFTFPNDVVVCRVVSAQAFSGTPTPTPHTPTPTLN